MKFQTRLAMRNALNPTLDAFGKHSQMIKTCEEMGELATVLCKKLNGGPVTDEQIIDEIADVIIMSNQMRVIFGAEAVEDRIVYKINRTLNFINDRKAQEKGLLE